MQSTEVIILLFVKSWNCIYVFDLTSRRIGCFFLFNHPPKKLISNNKFLLADYDYCMCKRSISIFGEVPRLCNQCLGNPGYCNPTGIHEAGGLA